MEEIIATHIEKEGTKIFCLRYTDFNSIEGNSLEDMKVGRIHKLIGCNDGYINNRARPQDIVVIVAGPSSKPQKFHVGIIGDRTTNLAWMREGGKSWKYVWKYHPITPDLEMSQYLPALKEILPSSIKAWRLFHPRFKEDKKNYAPYIARLLREGVLLLA